jgi:hypothetical protein
VKIPSLRSAHDRIHYGTYFFRSRQQNSAFALHRGEITMSVLKSGAILLLLAIPFFLYGAWQVQGVTNLNLIAADPPADKGLPSKEQIAANKAAAEKWGGDVRTVESVAFQFRQPGPGDFVSDSDCKNFMKTVAARSADLNDLEKFLSDVGSPKYEGSLKSQYEDWQASKEKLAKAGKAIDDWFVNGLSSIDGPDSATQAVKSFDQLLGKYTNDSRFFDSTKAAVWKVQCRIEVIKSLENVAKEPYNKVLNLPLPLPSESDSPDVKKALGAPRAIRDQVRALTVELNQVEDSRITLPTRVLMDVKDAKSRADEWAAKEELLEIFADPEPLNNPVKAGEWLSKIEVQFTKTQTPSGKSLIRKKVQQFCNAYIPFAAKLDPKVLIKGELTPRISVTIEYNSDAKTKPLSDSPDGLNEFNFRDSYLNFDKIVWDQGQKFTGTPGSLQPTPKSIAARDFTRARADVTNWSNKEVTQLKSKCEGEDKKVEEKMARRGLMDELVGISATGAAGRQAWTEASTKIWTRLTVLSEAMGKFPALFQSDS